MIKFVDEVDGKALYGNTIVEMTASNIDFCQLQCFLNNDCVSCNFGPSGSTGENICQLNNSTDRKRLQPRQGYTYLETEVKVLSCVLEAMHNNPCVRFLLIVVLHSVFSLEHLPIDALFKQWKVSIWLHRQNFSL